MLAAMRYLEPSDDIRSTFQYSNLGYLVASIVAERVSGQSWAEFTRALMDKLHMEVTFTVEELAAAADAAVPHAMEGDTRLRSKLWPVGVTAAGRPEHVDCELRELASFSSWQGRVEGQRLLSPGLIQELQKPRVHVGAPEFAEYSDVHYGLGFRSHRYRGERVVWHGGGFTGTNTLMMLLPDRGVGVAVLANNGMVPLFTPHILANYVFDRVCGKEPAPWLDRFRELRRKFAAQQDVDRQAGKASRRPAPSRAVTLADYAGDYEHPGYGRITITHAEGKLHWAFRGMSEPLAHRHYDTFELPEAPESPGGLLPGQLALSFSTDREGNIASVAVPFEPLVKDIVFTPHCGWRLHASLTRECPQLARSGGSRQSSRMSAVERAARYLDHILKGEKPTCRCRRRPIGVSSSSSRPPRRSAITGPAPLLAICDVVIR